MYFLKENPEDFQTSMKTEILILVNKTESCSHFETSIKIQKLSKFKPSESHSLKFFKFLLFAFNKCLIDFKKIIMPIANRAVSCLNFPNE